MSTFYHEGSRRLQDLFDSRRLADRVEERDLHRDLNDWEQNFVESAPMFFLATADTEGRPDVSYKGGLPGFVRVVGPHTVAFPNYDGNGMYMSMGNILVNPNVTLLFMTWGEHPRRLRVQGTAAISNDEELVSSYPGAQFVIQVDVERIFDNCPRYIHRMELVEYSRYVPEPDREPPVPEWKFDPAYRDVLPDRDLTPDEIAARDPG